MSSVGLTFWYMLEIIFLSWRQTLTPQL